LIRPNDDFQLERGNNALSLRIPFDPARTNELVVSISPHSVLLTGPDDESGDDILRFVTLPVEIDPNGVIASVKGQELLLILPEINRQGAVA
jgi:hypothetical protein